MRRVRPTKDPGKFCPCVGAAHIDRSDRLNSGFRQLDAEELGRFAGFDFIDESGGGPGVRLGKPKVEKRKS